MVHVVAMETSRGSGKGRAGSPYCPTAPLCPYLPALISLWPTSHQGAPGLLPFFTHIRQACLSFPFPYPATLHPTLLTTALLQTPPVSPRIPQALPTLSLTLVSNISQNPATHTAASMVPAQDKSAWSLLPPQLSGGTALPALKSRCFTVVRNGTCQAVHCTRQCTWLRCPAGV